VSAVQRAAIEDEYTAFAASQAEAIPEGQVEALLNGAASHHAGHLPGARARRARCVHAPLAWLTRGNGLLRL
jgi:superfamily II RNA helicase